LYRKQYSNDKYLIRIADDFLKGFLQYCNIEQLMNFDDQVQFDPEKHRCNVKSPLPVGAEAVVILPGWRLKGTELEVSPLVVSKDKLRDKASRKKE
jgi:hypothetical protein